jgi:glucoamylase
MASAYQAVELATFLQEFADWIEGHLEDWTVTNQGVLHPDIKRHYMRIRPPEIGEAYACEACGKERMRLANRPPGTRYEFEAREIIDAGFLELVRYGVRRADDPLMIDSLKVVDHVLKRDLPQGPGFLRYNYDGYGQRPDGGPFQTWGQGRVWPLLTGERAHYELAAGKDITPLIMAYEGFATSGQLMPEQVWDEPSRPDRSLQTGGPAGSAVPLVWAHAEYLKLLRSAVDGKVFDRIDPVHARYCQSAGEGARRRDLEFYSRHRPIQKIAAGQTLRILDDVRFDVICTQDNWQTSHAVHCRSLGSAGFSADIPTSPAGKADSSGHGLSWTLHWPDEDRWLGYNVEIAIEGE